jgi:predicted DNA-binding transcriptional regulator AlpA
MESRKKEYATSEVAKIVQLNKRTLYRWLYDKRLPEPRQLSIGRTKIRLWSDKDLKRVIELKQQMRRGRPSAKNEVNVDRRLLDFYAQLKWYSRVPDLIDKEKRAVAILQQELATRLIKKGLQW